MRVSGQTTRAIDKAIQDLFTKGQIYVPTRDEAIALNTWRNNGHKHPNEIPKNLRYYGNCFQLDPDGEEGDCQNDLYIRIITRLHNEHQGQFTYSFDRRLIELNKTTLTKLLPVVDDTKDNSIMTDKQKEWIVKPFDEKARQSIDAYYDRIQKENDVEQIYRMFEHRGYKEAMEWFDEEIIKNPLHCSHTQKLLTLKKMFIQKYGEFDKDQIKKWLDEGQREVTQMLNQVRKK